MNFADALDPSTQLFWRHAGTAFLCGALIGFLGAGVILARGDRIIGVTTAAVIWVLAAIGALIGAGYLQSAMIATLLSLLVLVGVEGVEKFLLRKRLGRGSGFHGVIDE
jgi:putative Mg2+ transporter-C (MgtC) family protein